MIDMKNLWNMLVHVCLGLMLLWGLIPLTRAHVATYINDWESWFYILCVSRGRNSNDISSVYQTVRNAQQMQNYMAEGLRKEYIKITKCNNVLLWNTCHMISRLNTSTRKINPFKTQLSTCYKSYSIWYWRVERSGINAETMQNV